MSLLYVKQFVRTRLTSPPVQRNYMEYDRLEANWRSPTFNTIGMAGTTHRIGTRNTHFHSIMPYNEENCVSIDKIVPAEFVPMRNS